MSEIHGDFDEVKFCNQLISKYCKVVREGVFTRWKLIDHDLSQTELSECIAGILCNQARLGIQFALSPNMWTNDVAPIIHRALVDAHITLVWVLEKDSLKRSQKYINYGLGQEKLQIEHLKNIPDGDKDQKIAYMIRSRQQWLDSQQFAFLTEVNVGSWSGKTTRAMAEEANCIDIYNGAYTPFSAATHAMWHHVARHNLQECQNVLHKKHRIPFLPMKSEGVLDNLILSAKYIQKSYFVVDGKFKLYCKVPLPMNFLLKYIEQYPVNV